MARRTNILATMVMLLISTSIVVGVGYYKSSIKEGGSFSLKLTQNTNPRGNATPVTIDLAGIGLPKKLLQPGLVKVSTHGIENKSNKAYLLQFVLTDNSIPVKFNVKDNDWDEKNQVLSSFQPGDKTSFELLFDVPKEMLNNPQIFNGSLKVIDYQTKEPLTAVPIKIINSKGLNGKASSDGDCCDTK